MNPVALKIKIWTSWVSTACKRQFKISDFHAHKVKEHHIHTRSSEGHFSCHWNMTNKVVFWRWELTRHELCIRGIERKGDLVGTAFITTALQLCGGTCQVLLRIQRVGTWCIITKKSSDDFFQSFQNTTDSLTHNKWKTYNHKIVFLLQ